MYFEKNEEGKLARFLCRSILLNAGMHVHFTAGLLHFVGEKAGDACFQVDVSGVKGVISKETLFNKRD